MLDNRSDVARADSQYQIASKHEIELLPLFLEYMIPA